MAEIMVRQWSFCPKCRGQGCRECRGKGTVVALIPLKILPAGPKGTRGLYAAAQKDFIKEQERQRTPLPIERQLEREKQWQDPEYRAKLSAARKKQWQDPEYRAKWSAASKKRGQIRMKAGGTGERPGINI